MGTRVPETKTVGEMGKLGKQTREPMEKSLDTIISS